MRGRPGSFCLLVDAAGVLFLLLFLWCSFFFVDKETAVPFSLFVVVRPWKDAGSGGCDGALVGGACSLRSGSDVGGGGQRTSGNGAVEELWGKGAVEEPRCTGRSKSLGIQGQLHNLGVRGTPISRVYGASLANPPRSVRVVSPNHMSGGPPPRAARPSRGPAPSRSQPATPTSDRRPSRTRTSDRRPSRVLAGGGGLDWSDRRRPRVLRRVHPPATHVRAAAETAGGGTRRPRRVLPTRRRAWPRGPSRLVGVGWFVATAGTTIGRHQSLLAAVFPPSHPYRRQQCPAWLNASVQKMFLRNSVRSPGQPPFVPHLRRC